MASRVLGFVLFLCVVGVIVMASLEHAARPEREELPVVAPRVQPQVPAAVPADSTASESAVE